MSFRITVRARVDSLFITALFSLFQAGCTTHHVFVSKEMTWECAPEHYMPDAPDAQTVRLRFVEAPEFEEEVSGRGLCDKLKASGKTTVLVGYDTFGNSFDGLVGFNEQTVDGERIADVGGWGSSGSHSMRTRPHPLEKLYRKHFKAVR
jgi:hypothetical protein